MEINRVAVIGAGLMGSGIAQVVAQAGINVINMDTSAEQLERAKGKVTASLNKMILSGKLTRDAAEDTINRIKYSSSYEDVKSVELVIEAVPEIMELKKRIFGELDKVLDENIIMVSNTSGLSISEIASVTRRADRVMGVHFFNPAPVMKLIELIRGIETSDDTFNILREFAVRIKKEPVEAPELPGFLVNRILIPMINEGAYCVMEGAEPEAIDRAMKLGAGLPMGPLELGDFVGLDVVLAVMEGLYNGFGDPKYRPCPILRRLVSSGNLGRKSGKGFYKYDK